MSSQQSTLLTHIIKRNGTRVPFSIKKITVAIERAMRAAGEFTDGICANIAEEVERSLYAKKSSDTKFVPTVEGVQDEVEKILMVQNFPATAKAYILYRAERTRLRDTQGEVPEHVRKLAEESKKYFKNNPLGEFVYLRTYARWIESENRRETWIETVDRYVAFMKENLGAKLGNEEYAEVREAILRQEVMP
ncbi:ribonucleoside-triphosphate reductase, partial [Patescibacteria group bacterium]